MSADEAIVQTLPLFEMMKMRAATTARRHPKLGFASADASSRMRWVNQFTHTHRRLGPHDREVVSPNNDTVYSNAWLDLSRGPVIIETPEMGERFWTLGLLDAWTNPFAYVGRRTTGNRVQRTLVHGPTWRGQVSDDISQVIAAPGHDVWLIGRILVDASREDLECVRDLQSKISVRRADGSDAAFTVDTAIDGRESGVPQADVYQATVDAALKANPFPAGETARWPIDSGPLADAIARVYGDLREREQPNELGGGWALPVAVRTHWGSDLITRARVARNLIGALGIEEAMYPTAEVDASGVPLDGSQAYALRFGPGAGPKVGAFWSLTMYRRSDCLFVANPIDRYSIGDRTPGLRHEPDGSLIIRMQPTDPGPDSNWLPTPPDDLFYVVLRLYQPQAEHLNFRYAYPSITKTQGDTP